ANRENNGMQVNALDHEDTRTSSCIPDERFSARDMLGWPNPVGGIWSGYNGADEQHDSGNGLCAQVALTRDPSLVDTLYDILHMRLLSQAIRAPMPAVGSGLGSPRGYGRPMLFWAHAASLGYVLPEQLLSNFAQRVVTAAAYRALPDLETTSVHVFSHK